MQYSVALVALSQDEVLLVGVGGAVAVEDGYHPTDDTATGPAALRGIRPLHRRHGAVPDGDHRLPILRLAAA
jgi:hypothetical protein